MPAAPPVVTRLRLLEVAREHGLDVALYPSARSSESPPHDFGAPALLRSIREFWSGLMHGARVPGVPIRIARRSTIDDLSVLGLAAKTAPDLRSALQRLTDHQPIWTGVPVMRVEEDPRLGCARVEILPLEGFDLGGRCRREMIVAHVLKYARDMAGPDLRPERVHFAHRAPAATREHEDFFSCELHFDSAYTGIELGRAALRRPLRHADPALSRFLLACLDALAKEGRGRDPGLEERVRRAIRDRLADCVPGMPEVARGLGTSPRSLRRHLAVRGVRYRNLVDEVRRELAEEQMAQGDLAVAAIAERLGFSEPSAFYRAFRRWTGGKRIRDWRGQNGA